MTETFNPLFGYDSIQDALNGCTYTCQTEALARMMAGENVFLSGAAGSGKTTVINTFIEQVQEHRAVAVTASTGIAAVLIGGRTIHSWAGLGIDTAPFNPKDISRFMYFRGDMIRNTDTLIIDEISMLPAHLFTKLDAEFKFFRGNNEPFGGMQIIASGDFQQLPPLTVTRAWTTDSASSLTHGRTQISPTVTWTISTVPPIRSSPPFWMKLPVEK